MEASCCRAIKAVGFDVIKPLDEVEGSWAFVLFGSLCSEVSEEYEPNISKSIDDLSDSNFICISISISDCNLTLVIEIDEIDGSGGGGVGTRCDEDVIKVGVKYGIARVCSENDDVIVQGFWASQHLLKCLVSSNLRIKFKIAPTLQTYCRPAAAISEGLRIPVLIRLGGLRRRKWLPIQLIIVHVVVADAVVPVAVEHVPSVLAAVVVDDADDDVDVPWLQFH
ncbi:hypothetical protein FF38_13331 [Lucilia cuprina]|uniref:Uncharacterized protein n=1 Tax=Lucilia cuprina TaxID=7375 RepID=A0A0L0BW22_LUCCU|nr:hypothetical protein FF38_13331 [Lucilia cuprina]